jgi:hypothetical protein
MVASPSKKLLSADKALAFFLTFVVPFPAPMAKRSLAPTATILLTLR